MSTFPLIGVSMSITVGTAPERAYVNSTYLNAIQQAGGVPVALPAQLSPRSWERLAAELDGLLLTGGGDIDPALFGEARIPRSVTWRRSATASRPPPRAGHSSAEAAPLRLPRRAGAQRGPGRQSLPGCGHRSRHPARHSQKGPRHEPSHKVKVTPGSRLAEVMGADEVEVNSMHHQAIKALGRGLVACAWAPDQTVEGVELPGHDGFVLGVQWHPEELIGHSEPARRLFSALVTHAGTARARK